jgi:hypothetical protein
MEGFPKTPLLLFPHEKTSPKEFKINKWFELLLTWIISVIVGNKVGEYLWFESPNPSTPIYFF